MTGEEKYARRKVRVERRAKYLQTLTPRQRRCWDNHINFVRVWRKQYAEVVKGIILNKDFVRRQGHNNLQMLKLRNMELQQQRHEARMMLMARTLEKIEYSIDMASFAEPQPIAL